MKFDAKGGKSRSTFCKVIGKILNQTHAYTHSSTHTHIPYNGYLSGGKIFVSSELLASSWKNFRGHGILKDTPVPCGTVSWVKLLWFASQPREPRKFYPPKNTHYTVHVCIYMYKHFIQICFGAFCTVHFICTSNCICIHVHVCVDVHYLSIFCFLDDRFIMKQIKSVEISSFEQIAPQYFEHVTSALENKVGERRREGERKGGRGGREGRRGEGGREGRRGEGGKE